MSLFESLAAQGPFMFTMPYAHLKAQSVFEF